MARATSKFIIKDGRRIRVPISAPSDPTKVVGAVVEPQRLTPKDTSTVDTKPRMAPVVQPPPRLTTPDERQRRVDLGATRLAETRAEITRPEPKRVEEIGAPDEIPDLSTEERIFLKKSRGEALTDDEKLFERKELMRRFDEAPLDPFEDVGDVLGKRIETLETEREAERESLRTEREKRITEKEKELGIEFEREERKLRASGERVKESAKSAMAFSGFARSTKSAEQQELIQKDTESAVQVADSRRKLQLQLFKAAQEGADDELLASFTGNINKLKEQEIQFEIDSAIKIAELNAENAVKGAEAMENLMNSFSTTTQRSIDKTASELLGFVSDEFGNPMLDAEGNNIPVNTDEGKEWGTFVDPFTGKTIFFNKANPRETIGAPGSTTRTFEQPDGSISSSASSNVSNMIIIGDGDVFTRDNGTQGRLGENCVKYARTKVPNLPLGLNNKQNKIEAIREAGETDTSLAQAGDAVLSTEGSWGHAFVIDSIDTETGEWIIDEANYQSGKVTNGRRMDPNDPAIIGFVSSITGPQQSIEITDNRNEGNNAGIDTQVMATEAKEIKFTKGERGEFRKYFNDGTLPKRLKFPAQQQEFIQKAEVFGSQVDKAFAEGGLDEIMRASEGGANPTDSFKNSWNKAVSVGSQLGSLVNLINEGNGNTPDTGELVDWNPIKGWLGEKNPWDVDAQRMQAMLTSIVPNLARGIFGEVGVLTDNDVRIYMRTIPNLRQVKDVQKAVASATLTLVRDSMANQLTTQAQSGVDVSRFVGNWNNINDRLDKINDELGIKQGEEIGESLEDLVEQFPQEFNIEEARAAGATDEEIRQFLTQ